MRRALLRLAACIALLSGAAPLVEAGPAGAGLVPMGGLSVGFQVSSVLPRFPCYSYDCSATFDGSATAVSRAASSDKGYVVDPVWEFIGVVQNFGHYEVALQATGGFRASVTYGEPSTPYCPAAGTAVGSASMTAPAAGVVRRLSPPAVGQVTSITIGLNFSYQRAGAAAAIVATGAYPVSVAIGYRLPDATGSFSLSAIGGGSAVFTFDPTAVQARCEAPGPMPFSVNGHAGARAVLRCGSRMLCVSAKPAATRCLMATLTVGERP